MLTPEAMIIYPENSSFYEYIQNLVGLWDYYVSPEVELEDVTAFVTVKVGNETVEGESKCRAYIYGWMPGSVEWIEGSCVAVLYFNVPQVMVDGCPLKVSVGVKLMVGEAIIFNSERNVSCPSFSEENL